MTAMMTSSIFLGPLVNNFSPFPHRVLESPLPSSAPSFTRIRSPKATATPIVTHHPAPFATALPKKKVLVPVGLGTEEMEAVIVVDVLRRAGADVLLASVEKGLEIEGSSGIKLVADVFVTSCISEVFDLIALPGGMPGSARLRDSLVLKQITSRHANGKRLFGAICAAPAVVLEPWGLMKRKQMTCHPAFMHKLPSFRAVKSSIQVSGELTTSRGPGTACEFAMSLVQQLFGDLHAAEVKEKLTNTGLKNEEFGSIDWSMDHIPQVLVPVANGSEEMEVVTIVDILRRANVNVLVASIEKTTQIIASQNTMIVADTLIDATLNSTFDMIILPGGLTGSTRLQKSKFLKKLLKEQKSGGRICGAIGSSTAILQKQGLLMNKTVVAHPSIIGTSKIKLSDEDIGVIIDGKVITSRGLGTAIDFSLAILYKLFGHARARSVAEALVYEYPRR